MAGGEPGGPTGGWKKVIVSGSDAVLNNVTATSFSGDGSNLTNLPTGTSANNATITISAGNALTGGAAFTTNQSSNETITINHQDTSTASSVNNSGNTFIQDITLDTYGHVTGLTSATNTTAAVITKIDGAVNANEFARFSDGSTLHALTAAEVRSALNVANGATNVTNNNQLTNGAGYTTNSGTITGGGSSGRIALWNGSTSLTSDSGLLYNASANSLTATRYYIGAGSTSSPALAYSSQTSTGLYFGTSYMGISIAGTQRFYLNANGVRIDDSIGVNVTASSTDGRIDAGNDIVAYSSSDKRWKKNVKPIENALDKVSKIGGYEFDWKELTEEEKKTQHGNEGHDIGVIAQEVEKVLPEVVTTRENGFKGVKYDKMVALLIESIKELKSEIEELKRGR
jgi:hypothetical protein